MFHRRSVKMEEGNLPYQVYLPPRWHPNREWPVILFLHGAGERGSDGLQQTLVGIGPALRAHPERFPCIVMLPQCPRGRWWPEPDLQAAAVMALEQARAEFKGDATMEIAADQPFVALTLRSLQNSRNDFLLTTFPIADAARPAPQPIIFPQIADGGGFITQFILLSPAGGGATTIEFYGSDGAPLPLSAKP
ncbi:MAG: hypothetical protein ABIG68_06980 [Acidobacteriota bacterium]